MVPKTEAQWQEIIKEQRIARIKTGCYKQLLDDIGERLAALHDVKSWMVQGLLDAAVDEWESRIHHYRVEFQIAAQDALEEEARHVAHKIDCDDDLIPF